MELRDLVNQARKGDLKAFNSLVDGHRDLALGYAKTLVRDHQIAEDAVQEAFVVAHRKLDRLLDSGAFVTWLRRIVWHRCLHGLRGQAAASWQDLEAIAGEDDLERGVAERLDQMHVAAAVGQLPESQRAILGLYYGEGLSQKQIGALLGLSAGTVNMRLHSARKRLKRRLIDMSDNTSKTSRVGHVQSADGALVTIKFSEEQPPLIFSRLVADGDSLCVIQVLPDATVLAASTRRNSIWTVGQAVTDSGEPFLDVLPDSVAKQIVSGASQGSRPLQTGIKTIDVFAPITQAGKTAIFAEWGVGVLVLLPELFLRLDKPENRQTFFTFVRPMQSEKEWRDINAEITLGSHKVEVVYIPVADPIASDFVNQITTVNAKLVLSRSLAEQGVWPSIDPVRSSSVLQDSGRLKVADEVRNLMRRYYALQFSPEATNSLGSDDWTAVKRARFAIRFLSQPFYVAEKYTKQSGITADAQTATQTFAEILSGQYDDRDKDAFAFTGATPKED